MTMDRNPSDDEIARLLADYSEAVTAEADAAFPAERLARQQTRILQRLEQEGRPGRVIAFPAGHSHEPPPLRARPGMRWIAGAAAAGLIIGVAAGHLTHDFSNRAVGRTPPIAASRPDAGPGAIDSGGLRAAAVTLRAVSTTLSEEEFLGQLEMAIEGNRSASLQPLDELTPRVWEIAAR
jgi:hypothetical protein